MVIEFVNANSITIFKMKKKPFQSPVAPRSGNFMQDTLMKAAKAASRAEQIMKSGKDPVTSFQMALDEMKRNA